MPAAEQNRINLAPWYLIAGKDELALKLRSELVVGEDSQGNLKLDPTSPSERWVKFKLDENILMMSVLHPDLSARWDTDSLSNVEKSVVLEPGTVISLPSTEIYVSHSLRRGKRFSTLIVENHPLPAAVVEPDLNIVMAEPKSNPSNDVLTTDAEPPLLEDKLPPPAASQPIIVTEPHGETKPTSNRQG